MVKRLPHVRFYTYWRELIGPGRTVIFKQTMYI